MEWVVNPETGVRPDSVGGCAGGTFVTESAPVASRL